MNYYLDDITEVWFIWGADDDQESEVPGTINIMYQPEGMEEEQVTIPGNYEDSETELHSTHVKQWVEAGNTIGENRYPIE